MRSVPSVSTFHNPWLTRALCASRRITPLLKQSAARRLNRGPEATVWPSLRQQESDNSGLQNLTFYKPKRVHLDKLPDGSPSGTTQPSAERFLCCVFDEFVPLGCKAPFPDKHARSSSDACRRRWRAGFKALRLERLHIPGFVSVTLRLCLGPWEALTSGLGVPRS